MLDAIVATAPREHVFRLAQATGRVVDTPLFGFGPGVLLLAYVKCEPHATHATCVFRVSDIGGLADWTACGDHVVKVLDRVDLTGVELCEV